MTTEDAAGPPHSGPSHSADHAHDHGYGRRARDHDEWRERGARFWRWLTARPAESWLFFAAGLVIGKIIL